MDKPAEIYKSVGLEGIATLSAATCASEKVFQTAGNRDRDESANPLLSLSTTLLRLLKA